MGLKKLTITVLLLIAGLLLMLSGLDVLDIPHNLHIYLGFALFAVAAVEFAVPDQTKKRR